MDYDFIIVDTKLMAFFGFHRRKPILNVVELILNSFIFNSINYEKSRIIFAHDIEKSEYRISLWKDYKGHRKAVQQRSSEAEQQRRAKFIEEYNKLPEVLQYLGTNAITKGVEADDIPSIVRHLYPDSNILLLSLDLDWLLFVDSKTHLLYFSTNTLYKTKEQVQDKIGINPDLYRVMSSIGSQAKDNILNIVQFGKGRFIKHLINEQGELREDYGEIIDKLLEEKKYGMKVHEKAKFKDWRSNFHLNLQLMSPIPIEKVNVNDLISFKKRLSEDLPQIDLETFLKKCYDLFEDIALTDYEEFRKLRSRNA